MTPGQFLLNLALAVAISVGVVLILLKTLFPPAVISPLAEDSKKLGGKEPSYYLDLANHFGTLDESQVVIDFSAYQKRVNGECSSGQAIRVVDEEGEVTCEQVSLVSGQSTGGSGVTSLTGGGGVTVNGTQGIPKTGALTLSTSGIPYSSLSLGNSIVTGDIKDATITGADLADSIVTSAKIADATITGADLASNISISTSGNIQTTGSGTITSAGLLTANNALTVSTGNLTLTGGSLLLGTGTLTSNVSDSSSAIGFTFTTANTFSTAGAKLFSIKNNTTEELAIDKDGNLTLNGNLVATGTLQGTQLISTVSTGTAPLVVSSTTQVANLNASLLEGNSSGTLMSYPQPNLVLNSDFGRRNKWMTFMPEVFADTSGYEQIDAGTAPTVSGNIATLNQNNQLAWPKSGAFWRDRRASLQWKETSSGSGNRRLLGFYIDNNNLIEIRIQTGVLQMYKIVAGVATQINTDSAYTTTLNNWYWFELETQGVGKTGGTVIGKFYSSGASPVAKSSAALVTTFTATVTDSVFDAGARVSFIANAGGGVTIPIGGLATGDGGVYVEGWGPESIASVTWTGTVGGQSWGYDETADSGPIGKQYVFRAYIPATNRGFYLQSTDGTDGGLVSSTSYSFSTYIKVSGKGGSGVLGEVTLREADSNFGNAVSTNLDDSSETSWARKTSTITTASTTRRFRTFISVNPSNTASGTVFFDLLQMEQGSVATPWRNAPADDGPIVWKLLRGGSDGAITLTGSFADTEPRDTAANIFLPWDANVTVVTQAEAVETVSAGHIHIGARLDATNYAQTSAGSEVGIARSYWQTGELGFSKWMSGTSSLPASAGKHRVAQRALHSGGAGTIQAGPPNGLVVTATRGK